MNTSLGSVAKELGVQRHQITYALESGFVPEPQRFGGRRAFSEKDVERLRTYFERKEQERAERRANAR